MKGYKLFEARLVCVAPEYTDLNDCVADLISQNAKELKSDDSLPLDTRFARAYKDPNGSKCVYVDCYYGLFYTVSN
jgi:hypothetical protein